MNSKFFIKQDKTKLKVSNKIYLFPMLSPTSKGTDYWDPAPKSDQFSNRYFGRVLLQLHQIFSLFNSLNINTDNKKFLDIGTGNGLIPQLFLNYSNIKKAVGIDPYEENDHITSWQPIKTNKNIKQIIKFIDKKIKNKKYLKYENYKKFLKLENFSLIPSDFKLTKKKIKKKEFRRVKIDAIELNKLNDKFDIIYCKAIEHIQNWDLVFKSISKVSKKDTILYFKHRSFFSYLGAHRFASIGIPWGHVILNDKEYRSYVKRFHKLRSKKMINFFFKGLTHPRNSVSDMCKIAAKHNFYPILISSEKPRYYEKILKFINHIKNFWAIIKKNHPNVGSDEILSGMHHIVLKKIK